MPATPAPMQAPSPPVNRVREVILSVALYGGDEFSHNATYQSRTLAFLERSAYTKTLSDERIIQRYALVCIYQATNNVSTVFTDEELDGGIVPWLRRRGWLSETDECTWISINCNNSSQVTVLDFYFNLVTGEFPPEVVLLKETLKVLDLGENFVFANQSFNSYLGQLTQLTDLRYDNTNFINDAGIPTEIGNLKKLAFYNCNKVRYTGALNAAAFPSDMTQLTHLQIEFNKFNSTVPMAIGQLPALKKLYLRSSLLQGDLSFLQSMKSIETCWVDSNPGLGGKSLPTFLGSLSTLTSFSVEACGYTGSLPTELGQLSLLTELFLRDNDFAGTVPTQWGNLAKLETLELQLNMINGKVPTEVCALTGGLLEELKADCVNCSTNSSCCTSCFDINGVEIRL